MPRFSIPRFLDDFTGRISRLFGSGQLMLSVLAMGIGVITGGGVIVFRETINFMQTTFFGGSEGSLFE